MSHDIRSYDYVNHPYGKVRVALLEDPAALFARATRVGTADAGHAIAALHVKLGALDIATPVAITVREIRNATAYGKPATIVDLAWEHARTPGLFPAMTATVSIYPLSATETQLELDGRYAPPLGVLGGAIDAVVGHRIARAAVHGFVEEVARYLRGEPVEATAALA